MQDKAILNAITTLYKCVNTDPRNIRSVTKYIGDKLVVRLTRRLKFSARNLRNEFVLTVGRPNYLEAEFIKACKAANEPFLVKKVQVRYYPKKKVKK